MKNLPKFPKNYIREIRKARNMSSNELSELSGISQQMISNIELSKTELTRSKIEKFSQIFNVHPLEILEGPIASENLVRDEQERAILRFFRTLPEEDQRGIGDLFGPGLDGMTDKPQESYTLPVPTCAAPFGAPAPSPDTATDAPISVVAPVDIGPIRAGALCACDPDCNPDIGDPVYVVRTDGAAALALYRGYRRAGMDFSIVLPGGIAANEWIALSAISTIAPVISVILKNKKK